MWTAKDIRVELEEEVSDGRIFTVYLVTPAGTIKVMAEADGTPRYPIIRGVHIQGEDVGPHDFGTVQLRWLVQAVMETMDLDGLVLEGNVRTTGANPGRRPRVLRFARKDGSRGSTAISEDD
jgi:hypothetical protein